MVWGLGFYEGSGDMANKMLNTLTGIVDRRDHGYLTYQHYLLSPLII